MTESFRISSDMLLERLKDLESVNFAGERPQTAQVLNRIEGNDRRPEIMRRQEKPQVLNLENGSQPEHSEEDVCPNCREPVSADEFAKHTIQCIRSTSK